MRISNRSSAVARELLPAGQERGVHPLDGIPAVDPQACRLPLVFSVVVDGSHGRADVELELRSGVLVELTTLRVRRFRHPLGSTILARRRATATQVPTHGCLWVALSGPGYPVRYRSLLRRSEPWPTPPVRRPRAEKMTVRPDTDSYEDVVIETIELPTRDGAATPAVFSRPVGDGPFPAIAIGAEGTGPNSYIRRVAATLSHLGFVVIVPDYYRGSGPPEPDNYDDFDTLMSYINALDFTGAVHDLLDAIDYVQDLPWVDETRVASWGYCTGGTIALFAACLRHDLATAVVFFPSQPTFDPHTAKKPVDVIDLVWNIACPLAFLIGDQDMVLPADRLADLNQRFDQWDVDATVVVYEGAGHAFNAHGSVLYNQAADEASWDDAVEFVMRQLNPGT